MAPVIEKSLSKLTIGERIRALRVRKNWKQQTLAGIAGIDGGNLSRMEAGKLTVSLNNATRLANALDCKRDLFLPEDAK